MSLEIECKICQEEYDMRHDSCPACWWRFHKRIPELEEENQELRELFVYFFGVNYEELAGGG